MADRLAELQAELREFVREREWDRFHDPKNLAMLIASEAGELVAEYRWVQGADADAYASDPKARARVEAEAADVGIALLLLFDRVGVDPLDDTDLIEMRARPIGRLAGTLRPDLCTSTAGAPRTSSATRRGIGSPRS